MAATARTSRAKAGTKKKTTAARRGPTFTCPECGKSFTRAASLGAHRNRAHGISGASSSRRARPATPRRTAGTVDRDALLASLFPNGIPARERLIREVNAWLDEAERLAAQR